LIIRFLSGLRIRQNILLRRWVLQKLCRSLTANEGGFYRYLAVLVNGKVSEIFDKYTLWAEWVKRSPEN
jgi:hypothetical protein